MNGVVTCTVLPTTQRIDHMRKERPRAVWVYAGVSQHANLSLSMQSPCSSSRSCHSWFKWVGQVLEEHKPRVHWSSDLVAHTSYRCEYGGCSWWPTDQIIKCFMVMWSPSVKKRCKNTEIAVTVPQVVWTCWKNTDLGSSGRLSGDWKLTLKTRLSDFLFAFLTHWKSNSRLL